MLNLKKREQCCLLGQNNDGQTFLSHGLWRGTNKVYILVKEITFLFYFFFVFCYPLALLVFISTTISSEKHNSLEICQSIIVLWQIKLTTDGV